MSKPGSLYDRPDSFGWISIALHWLTAIAITVLWLVGKSIQWQEGAEIDALRSLHVAIGLSVWILLAVRIVWRIRTRHPRAVGQSQQIHAMARVAHYLILAVLSVMIISGPVLAWAQPDRTVIASIAWAVHATAANILIVLVLLHVAGALKHLMFHDDETIARIFLPRRPVAREQQNLD